MSATEKKAPLLEIRGLTKEFRQGKDRVMAVHQIDLDIQKGEVFGLVGESGCGKSTFGNMLVHLLEPSSGTIRLNGVDITRPARRQRKDLVVKRREVDIGSRCRNRRHKERQAQQQSGKTEKNAAFKSHEPSSFLSVLVAKVIIS